MFHILRVLDCVGVHIQCCEVIGSGETENGAAFEARSHIREEYDLDYLPSLESELVRNEGVLFVIKSEGPVKVWEYGFQQGGLHARRLRGRANRRVGKRK